MELTEAIAAGMDIGGFDKPFDLDPLQPFYRPAAFAWCFQPEFPACLFDHMLGLVVAQVVLAPELGRFSSDFPQGVRFLVLTANFLIPRTGKTAWHDSEYAG